MTLIDDYSKYTFVYLLKQKSEVQSKIKQFVALMMNQYGRKPKIIRSDRGGEYVNNGLQTFFQDEGIRFESTAPYSPQQNGVAERKNRYLMEMTRCMLLDANMDK